MAKTNKTRSNKKSMNEYEAIQARTQLTPEEQAKYNRNRKIKLGLCITAGVAAVGAAVAVPLILINQSNAKEAQRIKVESKGFRYLTSDDYAYYPDAEGIYDIGSIVLEIEIKDPQQGTENKSSVVGYISDSKDINAVQEKYKNEKFATAGTHLTSFDQGTTDEQIREYLEENVMSKVKGEDELSFAHAGTYSTANQSPTVTMEADAAHDFITALAEAATQGDSLSNEILMKIVENQKQTNPSQIVDYYTDNSKPNKIHLELTSMELDSIIDKMSDKHKDVKQGLSELSYIQSQMQEQSQKHQKTSHLARGNK